MAALLRLLARFFAIRTTMIEQGQVLARIADLQGRVQSLRGYL
jgi:hypothetical protein